ncbi:hypothetical protein R1flu_013753 [Riccia fluitans]|uniref:Uncharacterized protein n=1 Tax=Riccia fluitans TaxID=41844 RepID=A0ABD1YHA9_9MARC
MGSVAFRLRTRERGYSKRAKLETLTAETQKLEAWEPVVPAVPLVLDRSVQLWPSMRRWSIHEGFGNRDRSVGVTAAGPA